MFFWFEFEKYDWDVVCESIYVKIVVDVCVVLDKFVCLFEDFKVLIFLVVIFFLEEMVVLSNCFIW